MKNCDINSILRFQRGTYPSLELDHGHSCIESWSRNHQRLTKLHKPIVQVQFVVLEKLMSTDLSQMAQRKSCDLLVISSS